MKPEFRIYQILRPLGWLYGAVSGIRNILYDRGIAKSTSFNIPVISIGNITVGGTGKTPHTEYTATILKERYRTAVLSRGYGRHTKGFIMSDSHSDSGLIGDEPLQIKQRFPDLDVAVCEERVTGIRRIIEMCSPDVILLDDAFQHRKVTPSLNILLVNWHRNILDDAMLPAGRMRESAASRRRADIIIVTKCPEDMSRESADALATALRIRPSQQVYFTTLEYGTPYLMTDREQATALPSGPVLAVTGIASPRLMEDELKRQGHEVTMLTFPDHYRYCKEDIRLIMEQLEGMGPDAYVVTTAKDAARLTDMDIDADLAAKIYVLPVGVRFMRDKDAFDRAVTGHVESFGK